ncbi:MAG: DUF2029 domain-containing protein [Planctomycetaceae bacterium]|nr:DUF2029 domain-containing protein [Planctomycetaceae bacterium]
MNRLLGLLRRLRCRPAWALAILAALLAVLLLQTYRQANRPEGYDLTSYLLSADALWHGDNPYQTDTRYPYIYPLFFAMTMIPLAMVPYGLANFVWFALSATGLIASCLILVRLAAEELKTDVGWHLAWPGLAMFLILFSPVQNNLLNGQVNLLVLFCCVLFLHAFMKNHDVVAAAWLAAAIAIKLLPVVLLLFVLMRRRWKVLLWVPVLTAAFCLLPWVLAGKNLWSLYGNYLDTFLMSSLKNPGDHSRGMFFGLHGTIAYFLPGTASSLWTNLLGLSTAAFVMLAVDVASKQPGRPRRDVWPFCAYLLGCLLASPIAETHHLVFAVPAAFLIGVKLCFDRGWATTVVWTWAGVFLACFCIFGKLYKTSPFYFAALMTLVILLLLAVRRSPTDPIDADATKTPSCNTESA